ncbi:pimeloyl-ACP methyl ester carboxylesterase [Orenia metallireducens]|jgi:pimeloyl-ACP methyl ester carboxylesterase|uniref:Pimeloyl-ACP methyl ester carboxylesterase n=1 Tax=Orenia metallireducens TaxID=1413210 RepID=A0A285I610_9FIRM|nr:alpha/beta hydrolase [Orenia metallireducens]PRX23131.1 pimeloyl-ACP methyl ester carboxylesterase [Orenia metallireducens]SNY42506.1 Pimeloyl-ACP methyl ester carboxylesterase [Orenia metallireducens]
MIKWTKSYINGSLLSWGYNNKELFKDLSKPILLFVHGIGATAEQWLPLIKLLDNQYPIIIINRPGYSQSANIANSSVEDFSNKIAELLDQLELKLPVIYIGHSMGGAIGLASLLNHSNCYQALVAISSFSYFRASSYLLEAIKAGKYPLEAIRRGFSENSSKQLIKKFTLDFYNIPLKTIQQDLESCDGWDIRDNLCQIKQPCLLITSKEDKVISYRHSKKIHQAIENSALKFVSNAGHNLIIENPSGVFRYLEAFLQKL